VLSTAVASAVTFYNSGCVDPTAALLVAPMAMITAPFGARLTARMNCTALRRTLGIFLMCVAPLVPLKVSFWIVGVCINPVYACKLVSDLYHQPWRKFNIVSLYFRTGISAVKKTRNV